MRKPPMMVKDKETFALLVRSSKAALIDLVVDMLRAEAGDEELDGPELGEMFVRRMGPVARFRGDR